VALPAPSHPVLTAAQRFRAELLAGERDRAVRLVNAYGGVYRRLQDSIQALVDAIDALPDPTPGQVHRLAAYRSLEAQILEQVSRYGGFADLELDAGARQMIQTGLTHWEQLTLLSVPSPLQATLRASFTRLHPDAVETMVGFLGNDSPLHQALTKQLGQAVADAVGERLVASVGLGWNPRRAARVIRDELGQGLNWSLNTSRTAQLWAYREANRAAMVANSQITPGWIWHSAMENGDGRTCMSCIAKHGSHHTADEVLNDHHSGRCVAVPETVSWQSLGLDLPDNRPQIPAGEDWFRGQTEAQQRQLMGDGMYQAWRDGKFSFQDLSRPYDDAVYGEMLREASLKDLLGENARQYYRAKQ
jgi:hypothetical protein